MMNDLRKIYSRLLKDVDDIITGLIKLREDLESLLSNLHPSEKSRETSLRYVRDREPASREQIKYLMVLYKRAGLEVPDDLDRLRL